MSSKKNNRKHRDTREYRLSVRAVRRDTPDITKLARAIIDLAMAQAEADAQDGTQATELPAAKRTRTDDSSGGSDDR